MNKIEEILTIDELIFYKNLKHHLKKFKRVYVNNSYVILFFGENNIISFVDYVSHDNAYKYDKKTLNKFNNLKF